MRHLKDIVVESIFDDDLESPNITAKLVKDSIKSFLKANYRGASQCKISRNVNEDGKYVVDCKGTLVVTNTKIESLTNDLFVFGTVDRCFECASCYSLTSLEGAPKVVKGDFNCTGCDVLTSLKYAPNEVWGYFSCERCDSLKSLEHSPKTVDGDYFAPWQLKDDVRKYCKVGRYIR